MVAVAPFAKFAGQMVLAHVAPIVIEKVLSRYIGTSAAKAVSGAAGAAVGYKRQGKAGMAAYDKLGHFISGTRRPWKG